MTYFTHSRSIVIEMTNPALERTLRIRSKNRNLTWHATAKRNRAAKDQTLLPYFPVMGAYALRRLCCTDCEWKGNRPRPAQLCATCRVLGALRMTPVYTSEMGVGLLRDPRDWKIAVTRDQLDTLQPHYRVSFHCKPVLLTHATGGREDKTPSVFELRTATNRNPCRVFT